MCRSNVDYCDGFDCKLQPQSDKDLCRVFCRVSIPICRLVRCFTPFLCHTAPVSKVCCLHHKSYRGCIDVNQFTIASEIFPSHLRAQGTAIAMSFLFLADTLWLDLAATAQAKIRWKYYLVFLFVGFAHLVFLYFKLPEVCHHLI